MGGRSAVKRTFRGFLWVSFDSVTGAVTACVCKQEGEFCPVSVKEFIFRGN